MQRRLKIGRHNHQVGIPRRRPDHDAPNPHHDGPERGDSIRLSDSRFILLLHKARCLFHTDAKPQRHNAHGQRQEERNAPAPVVQGLWREKGGEQRHDACARQQPQRHGKGLPRAIEPTLAARGELRHQRDRAAVLAAREQPLQDAQQRNNQRRGNPDAGVDWHNADGGGSERHQHQHDN